MTTTLADSDLTALAADLDARATAAASAGSSCNAIASDLQAQAAKVRASIVTAPPPAVVGFKDRITPDPKLWKVQLEDEFLTPAPEKQFLSLYGNKWDAAGNGGQYFTTSKKGEYNPNHISVVDLPTGERVMQCRLTSAALAKTQLHQCANPLLKINGSGYSTTNGELIMVRAKVVKTDPNAKVAILGWPAKWPQQGEADYWESGLGPNDTVGGHIHVENGGSNGEGQVNLTSSVKVTDWFTVGFERGPDHSYFAWWLNGQQVKKVKASDLKAPYGIPANPFRWDFQGEDDGNFTGEAIYVFDWATLWVPA